MRLFSIADQLRNFQNMLGGLSGNQAKLEKLGINNQFLLDFTAAYNMAQELDIEHEAAKAQAKEKNLQFHQRMATANQLYRKARKIVKLEMGQETWKEFGISDQR